MTNLLQRFAARSGPMNNNPNQPLNQDIGDGVRLVKTADDSFAVIEADGSTSVRILKSPNDTDKPYRVQHFRSCQDDGP